MCIALLIFFGERGGVCGRVGVSECVVWGGIGAMSLS